MLPVKAVDGNGRRGNVVDFEAGHRHRGTQGFLAEIQEIQVQAPVGSIDRETAGEILRPGTAQRRGIDATAPPVPGFETDDAPPPPTNRWDLIHFNTIQLMDDGAALLSARETSTMIKINDIEGTPSLDDMIGEPSVWNGMDAQPSFLTKVGDSGDTGGQHSITVQYDSSLEDGQYYIYMFDNDFGYAMTRPDFDWTMIDGISTAQSSKDENSNCLL